MFTRTSNPVIALNGTAFCFTKITPWGYTNVQRLTSNLIATLNALDTCMYYIVIDQVTSCGCTVPGMTSDLIATSNAPDMYYNHYWSNYFKEWKMTYSLHWMIRICTAITLIKLLQGMTNDLIATLNAQDMYYNYIDQVTSRNDKWPNRCIEFEVSVLQMYL